MGYLCDIHMYDICIKIQHRYNDIIKVKIILLPFQISTKIDNFVNLTSVILIQLLGTVSSFPNFIPKFSEAPHFSHVFS
jgi:hypothetical protein